METALFSAASLFHGDDDSDDGRGTTRKSTPNPSPPSPPRRPPRLLNPNGWYCLFRATQDEMEVGAEGKEAALEYVERAHEFPGMVRFQDPCLIVPRLQNRCFSEIGRARNLNYYLGYPKGSSYDPVQ